MSMLHIFTLVFDFVDFHCYVCIVLKHVEVVDIVPLILVILLPVLLYTVHYQPPLFLRLRNLTAAWPVVHSVPLGIEDNSSVNNGDKI